MVRADAFGAVIRGVCGHGAGVIGVVIEWFGREAARVGGVVAGIPPEQHRQTKAETFTVEGYNSRIRHYLARFKRKTKCYSKSDIDKGKLLDKYFPQPTTAQTTPPTPEKLSTPTITPSERTSTESIVTERVYITPNGQKVVTNPSASVEKQKINGLVP